MHLGIDLGGTKIETVVLSQSNEILYRHRIPSPRYSYDATLLALSKQIEKAERKISQTCTIGIGIPGSVSPKTGLIQNANSTWLIGHNLAHDLEQLVQRPIALANDADCFTLSESIDGAASRYNSVFGVILGTGVGGGVCINQTLVSGPNAITGEWGHNPMPPAQCTNKSQPTCYCGKNNCIETYLSGPGLLKHAEIEHQRTFKDVQTMFTSTQQGALDQGIIPIKLQFIERLAASLAGVVNILDPECIVVGGGLSNLEFVYSELPEAMRKFVFSDDFCTPIVKAEYGDSSGVRGAAWLGSKA